MSEQIVLLADDNLFFLRLVRRCLEKIGIQVRTACSSEEAIAQALTCSCAAAVISLDMQNDAGFEIVREFATATPHTECLLIFSDTDVSILNSLYENGNVYNHLRAPLQDIGDLLRQIGKALEHRALKRQNAYLLTELRDTRDALCSQRELQLQIEKMAALGVIADHLHQELLLPLTAIAHYSAYLRGKLPSEMRSDHTELLTSLDGCLREMQEAAKRCREIVRNARSFSQETDEESRLTNLHEPLYDALVLLRHTMEARGIVLRLRLAKSLPEITARPALLRQALVHLLINAIQAMPDGGQIAIETDAQAGVSLTMSDTGDGIPSEAMPHIFDPFFTTRPPGKGTGLGLTVAREIIRQHSGEIEIQSELNHGTRVMIRLPAVEIIPSEKTIVTRAA